MLLGGMGDNNIEKQFDIAHYYPLLTSRRDVEISISLSLGV